MTGLDAAGGAVNMLATYINAWAHEKGFWNDPFFPEHMSKEQIPVWALAKKCQKIALMHTELSELVEALRKREVGELPGFTAEEEEVADFIIRALDYAGAYNLRIGEAIIAKMAKNEGRPYKHGKEF